MASYQNSNSSNINENPHMKTMQELGGEKGSGWEKWYQAGEEDDRRVQSLKSDLRSLAKIID